MKDLRSFLGRSVILGAVGIGLLAGAGVTSLPPMSVADRGHSSPTLAIVTWPNGTSRTLNFDGVGCAISMCSRIRIQSKINDSLAVNNTWLDSVAAITDITNQDALFTFKDGTDRRLPIIPGNRFLYFANGKGEIGSFKSVDFVTH